MILHLVTVIRMFVIGTNKLVAIANRFCKKLNICALTYEMFNELRCALIYACVVFLVIVFKVFSIEEDEFVQKVNLKTGKTNLNYSTMDVEWNHVEGMKASRGFFRKNLSVIDNTFFAYKLSRLCDLFLFYINS